MAEVIKHSLIADTDLLEKNRARNWNGKAIRPPLEELQILVAQAIQVKIQIIQEDPLRSGRRTILNLGHTFAYAPNLSASRDQSWESRCYGAGCAANLLACQVIAILPYSLALKVYSGCWLPPAFLLR